MAKSKKIRRPRKELSEKQIERIKRKIADEAVHKAFLLTIAAMADTLNLDDNTICEVATDVGRWAEQMDSHILKMNEISDVIEQKTGLQFGRF